MWSLKIPQATNRKPVTLIVEETANIAVTAAHVPEPGIIRTVLSRTPPVAEGANAVKCAIVVAYTSRIGCKATFVGCTAVWRIPQTGASFDRTGRFHLTSCYTCSSKKGSNCSPFSICWNMPACWANLLHSGICSIRHHFIPLVQATVNFAIRFKVVVTIFFNCTVIGLVAGSIDFYAYIQFLRPPALALI